MSSVNLLRSIQIRSKEQYIFSPAYNRLSFDISPTGLSTDLSQSYLKLRMSLTNIGTAADPQAPVLLTAADFADYAAKHITVAFGNDGIAYSPASLIYLCRLRAKGTGVILEEIPFSYVLSQYLFQVCNDFETLGANNLLSGSAVQLTGHGSDLMSALSAIIQPRTEIQIPLRDMFGLCRHTNFDLGKTGGLLVEFELNQSHNVFQFFSSYDERVINFTTTDPSGVDVLPERDPSGALVFKQNPENMSNCPVTTGGLLSPAAFNGVMLQPLPNAGNLVNMPRDGWRIKGDNFFPFMVAADVQAKSVTEYTLLGLVYPLLSVPELSSMNIKVDNYAKVTLMMTNFVSGIQTRKPFTYIGQITAVTAGAGAVAGGFTLDQAAAFDYEAWSEYDVAIQCIEFLEYNDTPDASGNLLDAPSDIWEILENNFTLDGTSTVVTALDIQAFQTMGILGADKKPTQNSFDLYVQSNTLVGSGTAVVTSTVTYDRVVNDGTNSRRVYSNQATKLRIENAKSYIDDVVITDASGNGLVIWGSTMLNTRAGYQLGQNIAPGLVNNANMSQYTLVTEPTGTSAFRMFVMNCVQPKTAIDSSGNVLPAYNLSYSIDQAQIVLVQQTMTTPMTPAYSSWSVEVAAVESDRQQYSRQWIITQPNTYFGLFLTPDYLLTDLSTKSLVSTARGIAQYRISVNNVANTNRNVVIQDVTSDSPSSLHYDKLISTFQNSEYVMRSLSGIQTIADSKHPVTAIPINFYSGVVNGQYQLAPNTMGMTCQSDFYGSPKTLDDTIYAGPVFFFKQCIRSIDEGMGM